MTLARCRLAGFGAQCGGVPAVIGSPEGFGGRNALGCDRRRFGCSRLRPRGTGALGPVRKRSGLLARTDAAALGLLEQSGPRAEYGTGSLDDGAVETLGTLYSTATVTELTDLKLSACPAPWAPRVLALFHPQRPARNALREYLSAARVELDVAAEVEDVTSAWPLEALVPDETLAKIVSWLTEVSGANKSRVTVSVDLEAIVSTQTATFWRRSHTSGRTGSSPC